MRILRILLLLAVTTSAIGAPVITSITPSQGSEFGGTVVVIRGTGFSTQCTGCTPEVKPPDVLFGGNLAGTISWISSTELHAHTLPHAPGTVSVQVWQQNGEFTVANGFTFLEEPYRMTPEFGPVSGGTPVTITGHFGSWPYYVMFGDQGAETFRTGEDTLVAVSPPVAGPGRVRVSIIEGDMGLPSNLYFNYIQGPADNQERFLLPLLTPPVPGAFGSKFHTELRIFNRSSDTTVVNGLSSSCPELCTLLPYYIVLAAKAEIAPQEIVYDGGPARFVYLPRDHADRVWLNLRVYDDSRTSDNFGTEIPVVREREFFRNEPIVFSGVPSDTRFRNTLRLYGTEAVRVTVEIADSHGASLTREVLLQQSAPAGHEQFRPAYAQIGDLPSGVGPLRITVVPPPPGADDFYTPLWAFISVTNNDTQMITTIRP